MNENACVIMSECAIDAPHPILSNDLDVSALGMRECQVKSAASWGGPRANSGGPRVNSGGYRPGAGRKSKPKPIAPASYDAPRWFCVRTEYGAETQVDVAIRTAGFETLYPKMWIPPVAARRTESGRAIPATSERIVALLTSYTFVRFNIANPSWRRIATMRGVSCILSSSPERPIPIPDVEIASLRATLAPNDCKYPDADPEPAARVKKRWVSMLDGLGARQMEAA